MKGLHYESTVDYTEGGLHPGEREEPGTEGGLHPWELGEPYNGKHVVLL